MENPIKMDDLGVPLFLETPYDQCREMMVQNVIISHSLLGIPGLDKPVAV